MVLLAAAGIGIGNAQTVACGGLAGLALADCLSRSGQETAAIAAYREVLRSSPEMNSKERLQAAYRGAALWLQTNVQRAAAGEFFRGIAVDPLAAAMKTLDEAERIPFAVTLARARSGSSAPAEIEEALHAYQQAVLLGWFESSTAREIQETADRFAPGDHAEDDPWKHWTVAVESVATALAVNSRVEQAVAVLIGSAAPADTGSAAVCAYRKAPEDARNRLDIALVRILSLQPPVSPAGRDYLAQMIAAAKVCRVSQMLDDVAGLMGAGIEWYGSRHLIESLQSGYPSLQDSYAARAAREEASIKQFGHYVAAPVERLWLRHAKPAVYDPEALAWDYGRLLMNLAGLKLIECETEQCGRVATGLAAAAVHLSPRDGQVIRMAASLAGSADYAHALVKASRIRGDRNRYSLSDALNLRSAFLKWKSAGASPATAERLAQYLRLRRELANCPPERATQSGICPLVSGMRGFAGYFVDPARPQATVSVSGESGDGEDLKFWRTVFIGTPPQGIKGQAVAYDVRLPFELWAGDEARVRLLDPKQPDEVSSRVQWPARYQPFLTRTRMYAQVGMEFLPQGLRDSTGKSFAPDLSVNIDFSLRQIGSAGAAEPRRWGLQLYAEGRPLDWQVRSVYGGPGSEAFCNGTLGGRRNTCIGTVEPGWSAELGVYAPRVQNKVSWRQYGTRVGFFWAPVLRGGVINAGKGVPNEVRAGPDYWYYGAGGRVGLLRYFPSTRVKSNPPVVLGYLEAVEGRFGNLSLPQFPYTGTPTLYASIPWKTEFRGEFAIPKVPWIYVGGRGSVGAGPDDLRIFVGVRLELGESLRKLFSGPP